MLRQGLIQGFRESTSGNNDNKASRVLKNDLVTEVKYSGTNDKIELLSSVISEELYNVYACKIDIDKDSKEIIFTNCTCDDYNKKSIKYNNYCCKHLTATFFKFLNMLDEDSSIKHELNLYEKKDNLIRTTEGNLLDFLINKDNRKDEINFEIIINKSSWNDKINAEFKIGLKGMKSNKLYSLKDINGFLAAKYNKLPLPYGKDYTFDIKTQKLGPKENKLIRFIETLKQIDYSSNSYKKLNERLINGKTINIPDALLKEFLLIAKNFKTYLGSGFYSRYIETDVILGEIPLPITLKKVGDMLKLDVPTGLPEMFGGNEEIFLYNTEIYIPPDEQVERLKPYIEAFKHSNSILFSENEEERVLRELIPSLQKVTSNVDLSKTIKDKIVVAPVSFKFYFDKDENITLTLKVCYDKYEFNYFDECAEKVVYRDSHKEGIVVTKLREYGFEVINNTFVFLKGDDEIFDFFKYDIASLQEFGEVFYSERFTGIKKICSNSFKGEVKKGKFDYFEVKFNISDVDEDEFYNILRAFRDNKKYYKLKNGEFLDLEEIETNKLLKLIDTLEYDNNLENNILTIHKNKGIYLEDYIENNEIDYFKGRRGLKSLKNSLTSLKKEKFPIPEDLNATLRDYQKEGYLWLKSLDYMGFGGILGDEMGLGKTLQTITFLYSNKKSKSLIVAPTSLLYNWLNEFKKFAPNMKVKLLNGNKLEREAIIKNYKKYDVLITTYNLLKRDIELFNDIEFTYCILDEAQNIKNGFSQNAKCAKSINAKNRFALTGTPIENSLMELWSIFDFIMPGYLYDDKKFTTRYHRRLEEDDVIIEELSRLINPFILRRYKKDVIKELPDKIEKKLVVEMTDEQKRVYETYANHVKDIIEKKVKDDEFASSKIEILSYLTKLRQISLDPSVVMDNYNGGSGKIEALIETVSSSIEEGHKILVFSQFTSVLTKIKEEFINNDISFSYLDGSTPSKARGKLVDDFNNSDTSVFLISLKAGGTGLNLTSADVVIHFDPWWNPAVEDQATDRAHRIGQKNVVEVIKMVSEGSVEEKILKLQEEKKELIEKVLGEDNHLGEIISNLNENEVLSLFYR